MADEDPKSLGKQVELATKVGAIIVALIYLLGFLVNALYLARYGVSAVGLVRLQYVLAGVWVVLPFAVLACVVSLVLFGWTMEQRTNPTAGAKRVGNVIVGVAGLVWLCAALLVPLSDVPFGGRGIRLKDALLILPVYVVFICLAGYSTVGTAGEAMATRRRREVAIVSAVGTLLIITIVGYVAFFATRIYPFLPAALGGGEPSRVQFVLKAEDAPPLLKSAPQTYDLLFVTDKTVVVLDNGRAIEVSRDGIDSILYAKP